MDGLRKHKLECVDCHAVFWSIRGKESDRSKMPTLCTDCRYKKQRDNMAKGWIKSWPAKREKP